MFLLSILALQFVSPKTSERQTSTLHTLLLCKTKQNPTFHLMSSDTPYYIILYIYMDCLLTELLESL